MTEETKVIKRYKPFVLGVCHCSIRCGRTIEKLYNTQGKLSIFLRGHGLNKARIQPKGKFSPNWKGGEYISKGYIQVYSDGRYIPKHVDIYQKYHKLCMLRCGHVHHKDNNPLNNEISNLEGMTASKHMSITHKIDMSDRFCLLCNSNTSYIRKEGYTCWYKFENGFICDSCYQKCGKR